MDTEEKEVLTEGERRKMLKKRWLPPEVEPDKKIIPDREKKMLNDDRYWQG